MMGCWRVTRPAPLTDVWKGETREATPEGGDNDTRMISIYRADNNWRSINCFNYNKGKAGSVATSKRKL